ncbi:MAG TPA: 1,4-alpha-glucan branching protein GlgB [Beijerinckiaceae bacterium]|nr:1,4-alpha-glucan branching protein GlgB [Beijerinckiaceae bacterium]
MHDDPFAVLGPHRHGRGTVQRAFTPGAETLRATTLSGEDLGVLERHHADGFFEGRIASPGKDQPVRLVATGAAGEWAFVDPYSFGPILGPLDDYYAAEGTHLRLFDRLGAHVLMHQGVTGTHFAVWAPNARRVSVVGDFNLWDGRRHLMRRRIASGLWEIFLPDVAAGAPYKFEIIGADGHLRLKSDPYAFAGEKRPANASIITAPQPFTWTDQEYRARREGLDQRRVPVSVYEVHAGSWRRGEDGGFPSYDMLADTLIPYVSDMGFTHIEFLPLSEHPLDASWGYQPTGLFAPTARFGPPEAFARFVDRAHAAGLGVILDWVPAHFPTDAHGLGWFDGTALYEHADPRQGFHPDWNTAIYNFGRKEVASFLINNALFWLERYHIDGLRVDAVASMLYLDYSRKAGEWIPNREGGRENLEAIAFLRQLNTIVHAQHPGVLMIAEESTSFSGVSQPVHLGGLGFGFKWNMGFMHDTLAYLKRDPLHRKHHHSDLTFGLIYAFSENFVLPLSHDEVVHGKASLLHKMAGDDWQKFAHLRAYYGFMWGYPGKKLLFMGQEFGQRREWSEERGLDWELMQHAPHDGLRALVRDLNRLYSATPALHARDCEPEGFEWLVVDDAARSVTAWLRRDGTGGMVAVISNFTPVPRDGYVLALPKAGRWIERINTDAALYGGSGLGNLGAVKAVAKPLHGRPAQARVTLPPLSTIILELETSS